jgi:hypothetical protein
VGPSSKKVAEARRVVEALEDGRLEGAVGHRARRTPVDPLMAAPAQLALALAHALRATVSAQDDAPAS